MKKLETIKAKEVEISSECQRYGVARYCKAQGWSILHDVHTTPESALEAFNRDVQMLENYRTDDYKTTYYTIFELTLQNPLLLQ